MNQAFKLAKNEFIIYLNAGDIFFSNSILEELAISISKNPNFNTYIGGTVQIDPKNKYKKRVIGIGNLYKYLPLVQYPHPSFLIRKSVLNKLKKPFDSRLKFAADYKQQLILTEKKLLKIYHLNKIISIMPVGGLSNKSKTSIFKGYIETLKISFEIFNIISIYIVIIKIILNLYSRYYAKKLKYLTIQYK